MLGFYELQLIYLVTLCVLSLLVEKYVSNKRQERSIPADHAASGPSSSSASGSVLSKLTRQYLFVYAIVMGADWLQGPYIYSLYREQYGYPERLVASLFVTGFVSAGVTAPLVGVWADQYGRKTMCLAFCLVYALACVCILFPSLYILFFGRVLGGISTSILYSAFESWLISSSNSLALPQADLSTIMGRATLVNGFVATAAGVASNQLVGFSGSFASPFIASGIFLLLGWVVIRGTWTENYGGGGGTSAVSTIEMLQLRRLGQAWKIVQNDPRLLVLGLTQTCFEGSMYLFVFLWVPSLQEASAPLSLLPLGYIFSSFMISMMLGSLLYTSIVSYYQPSETSAPEIADNAVTLHAKLSSLVCALSALSFAVSVQSHDEHTRFWAFCVFEACVGMYYPVQGTLRGTLISNEHRATLSSLFRVPLNIFVVVSLMTGVSSARSLVLSASACMLILSSIMTGAVLVESAVEVSPPLLEREA